jgi:hypothetical protein
MLYFSLNLFKKNNLNFIEISHNSFWRTWGSSYSMFNVFCLITSFVFVDVYIGVSSFTTKSHSNTFTSTKMDEMVCYLCYTCIFSCECGLFYSISFTWLFDTHLCSLDFCNSWSFVSIFLILIIKIKNTYFLFWKTKILRNSLAYSLVFSYSYSNERLEIVKNREKNIIFISILQKID